MNRIWDSDQVLYDFPVVVEPGEKINMTVLTHCNGIYISGSGAILIKNRSMVLIFMGGDVVRHQMEVFHAPCGSFGYFVHSFQTPSILINRPIRKVIDSLVFGIKLKTQIAVAEKIVHAAPF